MPGGSGLPMVGERKRILVPRRSRLRFTGALREHTRVVCREGIRLEHPILSAHIRRAPLVDCEQPPLLSELPEVLVASHVNRTVAE